MNEVLTCEKLKIDEKVLVLCNELDTLKDLMNKRDEMFNTNLLRLNRESLDLKLKVESLVSENNQLLKKAHKAKSDLIQNRHWNSSSKAFNWLNTQHSRNKSGLEFVNRPGTKPVNKKYVGLQDNIICFHCEKSGYRYACPLRKRAMERNTLYIK